MKHLKRAAAAVVAAAALAGIGALAAKPDPAAFGGPGAMPRSYKFVGAPRCNARDCHGADQAKAEGPACTEGKTWAEKDQHAKAFTQLYKPASKKIATDLGIKDAAKSERCTACHTLVVEKENLADKSQYSHTNGVSCEVCHGAGEKWVDAHAEPKKNNWDHAKSVANGMKDVRDLYTWASDCSSCHLVIDHELVAKNHPKLNFELVDYCERMPPHWASKDHPSKAAGFTAKAWAVGAAVSMREAVTNHLTRQKKNAPADALKESEALVKAYYGVLRHVADMKDATPSDALVKSLDDLARDLAKKAEGPGADVVKKIAAEEPTDFDSARQIALALRALSGKAELKKLCDAVAAEHREKFDLAAFKKDLEAARALFK